MDAISASKTQVSVKCKHLMEIANKQRLNLNRMIKAKRDKGLRTYNRRRKIEYKSKRSNTDLEIPL